MTLEGDKTFTAEEIFLTADETKRPEEDGPRPKVKERPGPKLVESVRIVRQGK